MDEYNKEEIVITKEDDKIIEEFQYGKCHIFAMILEKEMGFEIECCWDLEAVFEGPEGIKHNTALVHAYCIREDGSLVDASGTIQYQDVEGDFGDCNVPSYERTSVNKLEELISENKLSKPTDEEIKKAKRIIKKFNVLYQNDYGNLRL